MLLFNSLILLYRFGGDRGSRLGAVVGLNAGGGSGDGSPSLATTDADGDATEHQ